MRWLRKSVRRWLDIGADLDRYAEEQRAYTDTAVRLKDVNLSARVTAAENSCRLIEKRLKLIEALRVGDGELGELAARVDLAKESADKDRLDASAAKLRGLTIEQYREDVEKRRAAKAARTAGGQSDGS